MNKDEAMKLALEALENAPIEYDFHGNPMDAEFGKQLDAAITALRQALEQPEQTVSLEEYKRLQRLVTSQGIRLMEYESGQEPVAWMYVNKDGEVGDIGYGVPTVKDPDIKLLYEAPPKREWVGLNNVEVGWLTVFDGLHHVETPVLAEFVRAVEAKLKEKNHD